MINPFVDWGFKYLFGTEKNKRNLLGFLNLLLELDSPIEELQYLNNESIPDNPDGKECVFDILCSDRYGNQYLIEIQNARLGYMTDRMIYYACRLVDKMGVPGEGWNYDIKKVYSICLMNFKYEKNAKLRRDFMLCEPGKENLLSDKLHFIMLQLPCLDVDNLEECEKIYEKFLYLLVQIKRGMKTIEELKKEVYDHGLNEEARKAFLWVLEDVDLASMTEQEKSIYEARLKRYRDDRAVLDYAIEDGIRQGLELGEAKGRAKGLAEGRVEIARSMKAKGFDDTLISECTGLSVEEINSL